MKICVIIPCYRVKDKILGVILSIPEIVDKIYVIDDCCPEGSGQFVVDNIIDHRVHVIFHEQNLGVGGAVKTGYKYALNNNMNIAIKVDGDGQMDTSLIHKFVIPLLRNKADYTKGNRFFRLTYLRGMPKIRLIGNAGLSFITKLSTGHYKLMDPTNGYTAIRCDVLDYIDLPQIDNRYFFETDLLFQLGLIDAKIVDIPMRALYEDENSSLSIRKVFFEFGYKHIKLFINRVFIKYFLRDFNFGSVMFLLGILSSLYVIFNGIPFWMNNSLNHVVTPTGTIIKYLLLTILGFEGFVVWLLFDIFSQPTNSITDLLDYSGTLMEENHDKTQDLNHHQCEK